MSKPRFLIKIKDFHEKSGMSAYAVAKSLGLNHSTVRKYLTEYVEAEFLPNHVIQIVQFYGLDWRDPSVIEVIEGSDTEGEIENPLAVPA